MGYLFIDHRGTVDPISLRDGRLEEYDTIACKHCQAVVKITIKGLTKSRDAKHSCDRCRGSICKACAAAMAQSKVCPGPIKAQIERAMKRGRAELTLSSR